jgi:hypothetical protein
VAFTTTTLSAAVAVNDTTIVVASAAGFAAGSMVLIDGEMLKVVQTYISGTTVGVLRGQNGTVTAGHVSTANVTVGLGSDFADATAQTYSTYPTVRARTITSYSAAGAIALPTAGSDAVAIINGTTAIAMTVANPTKDMDGDILIIVTNGKSTSTVTFGTTATGIGNAGSAYDALTLQAAGQVAASFIACNGVWCLLSGSLTGTVTALTAAIA